MTLIEWVLLLSVVNVVLGLVAVWQRHITYTTLMAKRRERDQAEDNLTEHIKKMEDSKWWVPGME